MRRLALFAAVSFLAACSGERPTQERPTAIVSFASSDAVLSVSVADSGVEQRRGLMGVEHLPGNEGMAFVYGEPVEHTFWMKDTLIPLSIAFVDGSGRLVGLRDMDPCPADPCPTYGIATPYVLAVEANRGWFDEHGVRVGDRAELRVMAYP